MNTTATIQTHLPDQKQLKTGILPLYKPKGISSKDVSRRLAPFLKKQKVGHVGTLDPLAEGVLPLVLGRACRVQDIMLTLPKTYTCTVKLGEETTTLDSEGEVIATSAYKHVTLHSLKEAAKSMLGQQLQSPPLYSAVKYKGKRLYQYARQNQPLQIDRKILERHIHVYKLIILDYHHDQFTFIATVSKGTYIRTLALDLAKKVSTLGYTTTLIRENASGITKEQTYTLSSLENSLQNNASLHHFILPLSQIELPLPTLKINDTDIINQFLLGKIIQLHPHDFLQIISRNKQLLALSSKKETVLLTTNNGDVLGLGSVCSKENHSTLFLHMHRSLL